MIFDLYDYSSINMIKNGCGEKNLKLGLTSGCFDLFHYYHLYYLERCKRHCDFLIVGVDSDRLVKETKDDSRPIVSEHHRSEIINALKCVDGVFIMDKIYDFKKATRMFNTYYIFKNDAFNDEKSIMGWEHTKNIVIIPDVKEIQSTTEFINNITKTEGKKK